MCVTLAVYAAGHESKAAASGGGGSGAADSEKVPPYLVVTILQATHNGDYLTLAWYAGQESEPASSDDSDPAAVSEPGEDPSSSGGQEASVARGPPQIGVIMGSDSDLKTMQAAEEVTHCSSHGLWSVFRCTHVLLTYCSSPEFSQSSDAHTLLLTRLNKHTTS